MNLGGNLDVNLGGKTHNFATFCLLWLKHFNIMQIGYSTRLVILILIFWQ